MTDYQEYMDTSTNGECIAKDAISADTTIFHDTKLSFDMQALMNEVIPIPPYSSDTESIQVENLCLHQNIKTVLLRNSITHLFPVQSLTIPRLLKEGNPIYSHQLFASRSSLFPSDICVSAPTGSGKTLCYVLPLLQNLERRHIPLIRALVILPTVDLALQVYYVFVEYSTKIDLNVCLLGSNNSKSQSSSRYPLSDIVICTPGKFVDAVKMDPNFTLDNLLYLVIDEADKMLAQSFHQWLSTLMSILPHHYNSSKDIDYLTHTLPHCQKLLFSATLTRNPDKLTQLNLYRPIFICSQQTKNLLSNATHEGGIVKYLVPPTLKQILYTCNSTSEKILAFYYFIVDSNKLLIPAICFTNTIENSNRLCSLLNLLSIKAGQYSSQLVHKQRQKVIRDLSNNNLDLLVCTDNLARGMDMPQVKTVINYDCPTHIKSYVHRVGRTARANAEGLAVTICENSEVYNMKSTLRELSSDFKKQHLTTFFLSKYKNICGEALNALQNKLSNDNNNNNNNNNNNDNNNNNNNNNNNDDDDDDNNFYDENNNFGYTEAETVDKNDNDSNNIEDNCINKNDDTDDISNNDNDDGDSNNDSDSEDL